MNRISLLSSALLLFSCGRGTAAELVLAAGGQSEYQIVVPDGYPSPAIGESCHGARPPGSCKPLSSQWI